MPKSKEKTESFESLFRELEEVVAKLEAGNLALDESLVLFQRGMELAKKCGGMLDSAELRIKELVPQGDEVAIQDFEEEDE
jgi:exodeoxyribonuclease VII small subunit